LVVLIGTGWDWNVKACSAIVQVLRDIAMEANCSLIEFENNLYEEIEH